MPEMELVELFGVIAPTLRAAIRAIYKSETLCSVTTQQCDLATTKSWATFYNLEVVTALAFRFNTYEASLIRQKVLESLYQRKRMELAYCYRWGASGIRFHQRAMLIKNETCYSHEQQVSTNVLYVNIYQGNDRVSFVYLIMMFNIHRHYLLQR